MQKIRAEIYLEISAFRNSWRKLNDIIRHIMRGNLSPELLRFYAKEFVTTISIKQFFYFGSAFHSSILGIILKTQNAKKILIN